MHACVSRRGCDLCDALPPQQTSEPSHPDIILIAINRHGVLLIHPKTKVAEGPGRAREAPVQGGWAPVLLYIGPGLWRIPGSSSDPGPLKPPGLWLALTHLPAVAPGPAHHLPLHQDRQLEQRQYLFPHGAGGPGPGQPPAV